MHIRLNRERKWDIEFRKQCHKKEMAQPVQERQSQIDNWKYQS